MGISWESKSRMNHILASVSELPKKLHLMLRHNTFYVKWELDRVNGKRRFKRLSLETNNYYQARQMLIDLQEYRNQVLNANTTTTSLLQPIKTPFHTVQEVIDKFMLDYKDRVTPYGLKRKFQDIMHILSEIGISTNDDYGVLNDQKVINSIETNILKIPNIAAKTRNRRIRCINALTKSANRLEPDYYKAFTIDLRSEKNMASAMQRKTYIPFTQEELIKIFNPDERFFYENADIFWINLIAIYCGGRSNCLTTLKYTDIITQDGIKCFDFKQDDDFKHLKTLSTVRKIPLHSRLIELGFLRYIEINRKKNERYFQNRIFASSLSTSRITKEKKYDEHIMRKFHDYLKKLKIKTDRYKAFHSYRNTLSNALEDSGVSELYIKKIVGWQGSDTRSKHYSTREIKDVQHELEKLSYPFLDESIGMIAAKIMEKIG